MNASAKPNKPPVESELPLKYIVYCGRERTKLEFTDHLPSSCYTVEGPGIFKPVNEEFAHFITQVINRHWDEVFHAAEWRCYICNQPATGLVHSPRALSTAGVRLCPVVEDEVAPICKTSSSCHAKAKESLRTGIGIGAPPPVEMGRRRCETCGKDVGLRLCGRCEKSSYCSRGCQILHWAIHKKECKEVPKVKTAETETENSV
ncbi:hypothetical protein BP6252_00408 [Coleophoma cylindrospora]|uniref:MYND-type domain-containing protein n=1 Tax=Coleophoma cylindrospora TaxID=1849047 RepID=A0A3D8SPZ0_9HELO|nr:hypothetical protein BP6252_00408 [Coleophoma cylindrospora]